MHWRMQEEQNVVHLGGQNFPSEDWRQNHNCQASWIFFCLGQVGCVLVVQEIFLIINKEFDPLLSGSNQGRCQPTGQGSAG